jgi:hypothetical protein
MSKANPQVAEMESIKQLMANFYLDKNFFRSIPIPAPAKPVEKEKAEVRPVKPKVTIPEVVKETIAAQGKAEKEPSAEERKLGAVRLVGTGDLVLRPPRVVKKGKMKTQQEEEETKGVGALLAKLRKAGEG